MHMHPYPMHTHPYGHAPLCTCTPMHMHPYAHAPLYTCTPMRMHPLEVRGPRGGAETYVSASFTCADGVAGSASWDFEAASEVDLLEVERADGSLVKVPGLMNGDTIEVHASASSGACETFTDPPPEVVQRPFVSCVLEALRTGDMSRCASTGESAMRTAAVIDAILGDYYQGRGDAFWNRPSTWRGGKRHNGKWKSDV